MPEAHDRRGDAAAYVLGALEPGEAEEFSRHLESCVACRQEVEALQRIADVLPAAAPQHELPKGLRRRVLRSVRTERGKRPAVARPRRLGRWRDAASLPWPAVGAATVVLAAAAAVASIELAGGGSSSPRLFPARVAAVGGSAEVRVTGGRAELIVQRLPPPPAGRIYELWVKRPREGPVPTGTLFSVTSTGAGDIGVPGSVRGVSAVLVTAEPAGGSAAPTRAPVIEAALS